jgi:hypothetical protein
MALPEEPEPAIHSPPENRRSRRNSPTAREKGKQREDTNEEPNRRTRRDLERIRIASAKEAIVKQEKEERRTRRIASKMRRQSSLDRPPIASTSGTKKEEYSSSPPDPGGHSPLSPDDFPCLRKGWLDKFADLVGPIPETLPPFREVNHTIPLIDPDKKYRTHHPKCPDAYRQILHEKVERYIRAKWWVPKQTSNTVPLLCIPKKNGKLRTAMDCRQRNDNTIKDVTPFPDQDAIRHDVARAPFRSKLDMSEAFEQIRIERESIQRLFLHVRGGSPERGIS